MQIDELKKLQAQMQESARSFENSIRSEVQSVEQLVDQTAQSVEQLVDQTAQPTEQVAEQTAQPIDQPSQSVEAAVNSVYASHEAGVPAAAEPPPEAVTALEAAPETATGEAVAAPPAASEHLAASRLASAYPPHPAPRNERRMNELEDSFLSHLFELRDRLIRARWPPFSSSSSAFSRGPRSFTPCSRNRCWRPCRAGGQMIATDVVGVFLVPMKVALMVAFLIALPYVLYQIWAFVAPGLYAHEKKLALPLVAASVVLFFIGMAFAYLLVFPTVFGFMAKVAPEGVAWMTDIEKYLSFVMTTFIAFGVTFEVPIVVIVLVQMGVVSLTKLKELRPYVIVGAFVIGAIFTPPDVISQLMLAGSALPALRARHAAGALCRQA